MKKRYIILLIAIFTVVLTGCGNASEEVLSENMRKIELTGNLVTYEAYYHNVIEYEKPKENSLVGLFQEDRKLFAEYRGTIKLGIDLTKVKITVKGNTINVFVPKATVIGKANVDEDSFKKENFIESQEGLLIKNPITVEDSSKAFDQAQEEMKEAAMNDSLLLSVAQKRAKILLEENINQFSGISSSKYKIEWEYE